MGWLSFGFRTGVFLFTVQRATWRRLGLHSGSVSLVLPPRSWEVGRQGAGGWGTRLLAWDCLWQVQVSVGRPPTFFTDFLFFRKRFDFKKLVDRTPCGLGETGVGVEAGWLTFRSPVARRGGQDCLSPPSPERYRCFERVFLSKKAIFFFLSFYSWFEGGFGHRGWRTLAWLLPSSLRASPTGGGVEGKSLGGQGGCSLAHKRRETC